MAIKFIVALAFVAVVAANQIHHPEEHGLAKSENANNPHPQYQFSYAVNDATTGDVKSQSETRDGDTVLGEYSLNDADGYKRIVQYAADSLHGFNAVVRREPLGQIVKSVAAAPALIKSAPVAYAAAPSLVHSAPLGYVSHATPAYTQTYAAAVGPQLIRSAPIAYSHGPAAYTTHSLVSSAPIGYASAPAYAAVPAYAIHH